MGIHHVHSLVKFGHKILIQDIATHTRMHIHMHKHTQTHTHRWSAMNSWLSTAVEIPPASLLELWPLIQRGRVGGHELEYSFVL